MAEDTVAQIKARLSIVDVVSAYVQLGRAGSTLKAKCPFHNEKSPSFIVSPDRGTYHCFGCNVGGDMFTFVQEIEGVDFKGALKMLAEKAGVPLVYSRGEKKDPVDRLYAALEEAARLLEKNITDSHHPARAYLAKRGLTEETIQSFRLGWVPDEWRTITTHLRDKKFTDKEIEDAGLAKKTEKGLYDRFRSRIMFPLFDSAGRVVGFSGRIFAEKGEPPADAPKYLNSPEGALYHKSKLLYGYDRAKQHIRKLNFSILVEGQMDLVTVHQAGWKNAVAVSGTALTEDHVALLMRMSENIVLALDADKAGVEAARRSALIALARGMDVKVAELPSAKDPADYILSEGVDAWKARIREAKHVVEYLLNALAKQHADPRAYAKAARATVLPFIAMIKSPIDRDHFVQLVAARLSVSEDAVRDEMRGKTYDVPAIPEKEEIARMTPKSAMRISPRLKQACGIVAWQEGASKAVFTKSELLAMLRDSASKKGAELLETLTYEEKRKLSFEAEHVFAHVADVKKEIEGLFRQLKIDRLRAELKAAETDEEKGKKSKELQGLLGYPQP